jgi:hypothetical protein
MHCNATDVTLLIQLKRALFSVLSDDVRRQIEKGGLKRSVRLVASANVDPHTGQPRRS